MGWGDRDELGGQGWAGGVRDELEQTRREEGSHGLDPPCPRAAPATHPSAAGEGPGPTALLGRGPCPHGVSGGVPRPREPPAPSGTAGPRGRPGRCSGRALLPARSSWRSRARGIRAAPALPPQPTQPLLGKPWSQLRASREHLAGAEQTQKHPGAPPLSPEAPPAQSVSPRHCPHHTVPTTLSPPWRRQNLRVASEQQHIWAAVAPWLIPLLPRIPPVPSSLP